MPRASKKSPDAFRTISEAADALDLPQHVLRFWETRFSQIKPMKRSGGRRYYRPSDLALLGGIRFLLYEQGYTIKGVQRILKEQGVAFVSSHAQGMLGDAPPVSSNGPNSPAAPTTAIEADAAQAPVEEFVNASSAHDGASPGNHHGAPVALDEGLARIASKAQPATRASYAPTRPPAAPSTNNGQARVRLSHADTNALATALRDLIECKIMLDDVRVSTKGKNSG